MKRAVVILAIIAMGAYLSLASGVARSAEPVKIGFFAPLSGFAAEDGISARRGADLALEKLKASFPDKPMELVVYDDQGDHKQATSIVRKLITYDKVSALVSGSYSGPTKVASPIAQEFKIPLISAYAVHPEITKTGDYIFRLIYTGDVKGKALAYYAIKKLGKKKLGMLYWEGEWGASIADGAKPAVPALGGEIIFSRSFSAREKDFGPHIIALKEAKPEALLLISIYGPGAQIVRKLKELDVNIPMVAPDGLDASKFPGLAGPASEGVYVVTNFSRDDKRPVVQTFIKEYKEKYKADPDMVASSSYDAVRLMGEAIAKAGAEPSAIRNALAQLKDVEGLSGKLTFTKDREVSIDITVNRISEGAYKQIDKITYGELFK